NTIPGRWIQAQHPRPGTHRGGCLDRGVQHRSVAFHRGDAAASRLRGTSRPAGGGMNTWEGRGFAPTDYQDQEGLNYLIEVSTVRGDGQCYARRLRRDNGGLRVEPSSLRIVQDAFVMLQAKQRRDLWPAVPLAGQEGGVLPSAPGLRGRGTTG